MSTGKPNRKPAHLEYAGGKSPRQHLWELIRAWRDGFTWRELVKKAPGHLHEDTARSYLKCLVNGGYLERTGDLYRLIKDHGVEAPRLRKDGQPVTLGQAQENLWRTLRALDHAFTPPELAALASTAAVPIPVPAAQEYLKWLLQAGYVRREEGRYRIALDTGPRPPQVQRVHRVYDPNLGRTMWNEPSVGVDHE